MRLDDLILLVRVVDAGGFAAAARGLGLPRSTVSKRIAELETALGVRLIHRTTRRFVLTQVGEDVCAHARAALIEAEAARDVATARLSEPQGTVRLTAALPTVSMALSWLLPELAVLYPKITLCLHATNRYVDSMQEGFDIAVRTHRSNLPDSDLLQRNLGYLTNLLVASPAYLERYGTPATPHDLAAHRAILADDRAEGATWTLERAGDQSVRIRMQPALVANDPMTMLAAALAGLGIASLPRPLCAQYLEGGSLTHVLPQLRSGVAFTSILTTHRRGQLPSVRAVVDFLAQHLPRRLGLMPGDPAG